jgi:hypothetical protein
MANSVARAFGILFRLRIESKRNCDLFGWDVEVEDVAPEGAVGVAPHHPPVHHDVGRHP